MIHANGSVYTGHFSNGKQHGQGRYKSPENLTYEGTFENNLFKQGTITYPNERTLSCNWSWKQINGNIWRCF